MGQYSVYQKAGGNISHIKRIVYFMLSKKEGWKALGMIGSL